MMQQSFAVSDKEAEEKIDEIIFKRSIGDFVEILSTENRGQILHPTVVVTSSPKIGQLGVKEEIYVKHINAKETISNIEQNNNQIVFVDVDGKGSDGGGYVPQKNLVEITIDPFYNVSQAKTDMIRYLVHANRKDVLVR